MIKTLKIAAVVFAATISFPIWFFLLYTWFMFWIYAPVAFLSRVALAVADAIARHTD